MSYGIQKVTSSRPCPICGKPDWCGFMPISEPGAENGELVLCMRDTKKKDQDGYDGLQYVYRGNSRSDNSVFEELHQYQARKEHKRYANNRYGSNVHSKKEPMAVKHLPSVASANVTDTVLSEVKPQTDTYCAMIYQKLQSLLILDKRHYDYLKSQGWSDELIQKHHIVSWPEEDSIYELYKNRTGSKNPSRKQLAEKLEEIFGSGCLLGVPGSYEQDGHWTFAGPSGILYPMYNLEGEMFRMRIRKDFMDTKQKLYLHGKIPYYYEGNRKIKISMKGIYEEKNGEKSYFKSGGKYRTLASWYEDKTAAGSGIRKNIYHNGCQALNSISLYTQPGDDMSIWFITEGEPKGIFTNDHLKSPLITLPGVNSYALILQKEVIDKMKAMGMIMAVVLFDADKAHNDKVLACENNLIEGLKAAGIATAIGDWDENIGKGCDDLLAAGGTISYRMT